MVCQQGSYNKLPEMETNGYKGNLTGLLKP